MRIAHVVPRGEQPWSGVLTVIVDLAAALARRGHDAEVWQFHDWSPTEYAEQRERLLTAGVVEVRVPGANGRPWGAARLAEARALDLVHLHGAFNPTNAAVARFLRRPYVFSPHSGYDPVSLLRSRGRKLVYRTLFERRMLRRASRVVALTEAERADVVRFGATGPVDVVPNGVEPAPKNVDRDAFRRELGIAEHAALAVFVGRLDVYRKGLDTLVSGVAGAPEWHLALIGPVFRDVDRLRELIAGLGVVDRVRIVGERHGRALRESVSAASVFTLLSRWEGLPMALLEALSLSIPAVVSPAVERVVGVEAAGAGWVAPDGQLSTILRRLSRVGSSELERRGAAAARLAGRYTWDDVARRYEDVYQRALGSGQVPT